MPKYSEKPEACKLCPAYTKGLGFIKPSGPLNSPLALVSQPDEQDAIFSTPFYANSPTGHRLDLWLNKAAKSRTQVLLANIVQCWLPEKHVKGTPKGTRSPTLPELEFCWEAHVGKTLQDSKAKFISPIGVPATKWLLGIEDATEKYIGTFTQLDLREIEDGRETARRITQSSSSEDRNSRTQNREQRHILSYTSNGTTNKHTGATNPRHEQPVPNNVQHDQEHEQRTNPTVQGSRVSRNSISESIPSPRPKELSELFSEIESGAGSQELSLLQRSSESIAPRWFMPLMHPSAVVRGRWEQSPIQEVFMKRLLGYAFSDTEPVLQDPTKPPPNTLLYPTLTEIALFNIEADRAGAYSLDIEEAGMHVICVGMTAIDLNTNIIGTTICLRFRKQGGDLYWENWEDHLEAVKLLQQILLLPVPKIFQNGITFDIPELAALGLEIVGPFIDTMHLAHTAYPEFPKGLQFLATLWLEAPVWKTLVDGEELDGKG